MDESKSYRVKVHSFNKQISQSEKVATIEVIFKKCKFVYVVCGIFSIFCV